MVEAHDAIDFGPRQAKRRGQNRLRLFGNIAPFRLNIVQDRQKRPFTPDMDGDDLV